MDRGDVYSVELDPTKGLEQRGRRPVLVISRAAFNKLGIALVCPITQGGLHARMAGWSIPLATSGMATQGVILCHQLRTLDIRARDGRRIETAPDFIIDNVLARIQAIID